MQMTTLATKDELDIASKMTATKFKEVTLTMDSKITETQIMSQTIVNQLESQVYSDLKNYHKASDFQAFIKSYETQLKTISKKFIEQDDLFTKGDEETKVINERLDFKAEEADLQEHIEHSLLFAFKTEVKAVEHKVMPILASFTEDRKQFYLER